MPQALPAPLSVVAGAHLEQCPHCRQRLREAEAIGSVLLSRPSRPRLIRAANSCARPC